MNDLRTYSNTDSGLAKKLNETEAKLSQAVALLRKIEWDCYGGEVAFCGFCGVKAFDKEDYVHGPSCELDSLLKSVNQ